MHIHLLPLGSAGDVFPLMWLGRLLKARGHEVTMITSCLFEKHILDQGLKCVPLGRAEDFEALLQDPRIWQLMQGPKAVFEEAMKLAQSYLTAVESHPPVDLILAPVTAIAGRLAREKLGVPLITIHMQPAPVLSAYEPPLLHPAFKHFRTRPLWFKKLILSLPNPVDFIVMPKLRALCKQNGVVPPRSFFREWWDSPDGTLMFFPDWFAAPQPDWPREMLQWTFPLEDLGGGKALSPELAAFLDAGEPPVLFTAGSANKQAAPFFQTAVESMRRLGRRAMLLTRYPSQVPADLPPGCIVVEYAPFSHLLPRAAALVHHGGIGTLSQAFAAGVPQLIMPMAHDQPDNADRIERMGAGLSIQPDRFEPERVTAALRRLLTEPSFRETSQKYAGLLAVKPDTDVLLRWVESRAKQPVARTTP